MKDLPSTIKHPETFLKSPAAGFDGVFDWSWTGGCFGNGKITPMDFDGVVERKGNFLVFETKDRFVPVPHGQLLTYRSAFNIGCFTIIFIEGKERPERAKIWCQPGFMDGLVMQEHIAIRDFEKFRQVVSDWYLYANQNPRQNVDISFLNKRVKSLEEQADSAKRHLADAVAALGGSVTWG